MRKAARRLKVWRAERDLTQMRVARLAGIGTFRYWQIEAAEGPEPKPEEQQAIAEALQVAVGDVLWSDANDSRPGQLRNTQQKTS